MRHPKNSLRTLVALAALLIILMSVFSDFRPLSLDHFDDLPDGQVARVQCEVTSASQSLKGWILILLDFEGGSVTGFLAAEDGPPPDEKSLVEVKGTWSVGNEMFFVHTWIAI